MSRSTRSLLAAAAMLAALQAGAQAVQPAPPSYQVSPEVYKLLAENEQFRVVLATWKPGQRDLQHSHLAGAVYRLTDCKARAYGADGKVLGDGQSAAGTAALQGPIPSHALENIGTADCQVLIVERK